MAQRMSASLAFALSSLITSTVSAGFTAGDVYVVSASLPASGTLATQGIYRLVASSGEGGVWLPLPVGSFGPNTSLAAAGATYDPYRDRLLLTLLNGSKLGVVDADGAISTIPVPAINFLLATPGPNGVVYLVAGTSIYYLDATNAVHQLFAQSGAPLDLAAAGLPTQNSAIFDVGTSSLIVVGPNGGQTRFARIPLAAGGTQVVGPISLTNADLIAGEGENVAGLSAGPSGSLFVTIDINANGIFAQLQTLNPVTFTPSTFATTSGFFNAGLTTGTWQPTWGLGLGLDTGNDVIRAYAPGGSGVGTIVATGASSAGGSAEAARMIAIGATINGALPVEGDLDGDGHVGASDLAVLLGAWGPCANCAACPGDIDGDCAVNAADLSILLGNWG